MKLSRSFFCGASFLAVNAVFAAGSIELDAIGSLSMGEDDIAVRVAVVAEKYGDRPLGFVSDSNVQDFRDGLLPVHICTGKPKSRILHGTIGIKSSGRNVAVLRGDFMSAQGVDLTGGIGIVVTFPAESWSGSQWRTDSGSVGLLPGTFSRIAPFHCGRCRRIEFSRRNGSKVAFEFPEVVEVAAFDDRRQRGIGISLRMMVRPGMKIGRDGRAEFTCKVIRDGGLKVRQAKIIKAVEGDEWVPFRNLLDIEKGSALDFSGMGFQDAPAGKYGWLKAVGGHFEFERKPGVAQRFYGVNLAVDAVCPEKKMADALVTRLVRLGYNSIRIHHHEKPILKKNGRAGIEFNGEALDRLDYLIAKATEAGIYITTDLFVSRPVAWRAIGEDRDGFMTMFEYKSLLVLGHPGAMSDWSRFTRAWLGHVNPYTGRTLAEEPALITLGLVNEGHLGMAWHLVKNMPVAQEKWERWLQSGRAGEFGIDTSSAPTRVKAIGSFRDTTPVFSLFAADLEREKIKAMSKVVREMGYRGLLFNDNNGPKYAARQLVRDDACDIVDVHFYIDHPSFLGVNWTAPYAIEGANPFFAKRYAIATVCAERLYGKPFTVTEWQHASVSPYRSTAGLLIGAVAAGQDWSALWRFAYAHGAKALKTEGARLDSFDLSGDPVKQATDRMFTLLYLRGDMPVFENRMTFGVTKRSLKPSGGKALSIDLPGWSRKVMFESQIGSVLVLDRELPNGGVSIEHAIALKEPPDGCHLGKSQLRVDEASGSFSLVTPRTCGGFSEAGGKVYAGPISFSVSGHKATVSASSIDGKPLASSSRILVTHLTDVSGEGARFANERHTMILDYGRSGTTLVRAGRAEISLALTGLGGVNKLSPTYTVYALDTSGRRDAEVPAIVRNGSLVFTAEIRPGSAHIYYEVVR